MNGFRTDQYVRDKLSDAETEAYELEFLESQELQDDLEDSLVLKQALVRGQAKASAPVEEPTRVEGSRPIGLAWAACLAFFTVGFLVLSNNNQEIAMIEHDLAIAKLPRTEIVTANINIVRSGAQVTPDAIIQLPDHPSSLMLNLELGPRSIGESTLNIVLKDNAGTEYLSWQAQPNAEGHTIVSIHSELVPSGLTTVQIENSAGNLIERRSIQFKRAD